MFLNVSVFGQNSNSNLAERIAELKARSNLHEGKIAKLLAEPQINRTDFSIPSNENRVRLPSQQPPPSLPSPAVPTRPFIPVPEYSEMKEVEPSSGSIEEVETTNDQNKSSQERKDLDDAYAKLYEPDIPSRLLGYYFGPILGLAFPQDGAVRVPNPPGVNYSRLPYESDSGYLIGLQVGKDFGSVRVEAEYSYHSFEASTLTSSLSASIHNFFSRLILEKELGDRFDLRVGLGMGMGIVGLESLSDYSGTGFAYDFLLGGSYRLAENWSLQADYRYFLTAAHDRYDHIKSHLWVLSASLDL